MTELKNSLTDQQACLDFFQSRSTLMLSTVNSQGTLETSVAPFVTDNEGHLYLFVSELARHTQNILEWITVNEAASLNPDSVKRPGLVSCLLVADEIETKQLFARERLTMQLELTEVLRASSRFEWVMTRFESKFGEIITLLKSLPDFHLIQLTPVTGGYVKGFGQAFTFKGFPGQQLQLIQQK